MIRRLTKKILSPYHFSLSMLGATLYRHPSRKLKVIGVTGTKGKTTVLELINAGLEEAGKKTAILSSIRRKVGDKDGASAGNSMPGRFAIQKFLSDAVKAKCDYALVEVTSEGVTQHRHRNIEYDAAVFINLHPEHIESHGSFEKYRKAKTDFFRYAAKRSRKEQKHFFINKDDENMPYFLGAANGGKKVMFGKSDLRSNMAGEFNKYNLGAAEAVLKTFGIPQEVIARSFAKFTGVPGRMEYISRSPFEVVVDYAHTPGSLESVYKSLSDGGKKKLIGILGSAGGGRDKWKRPKFGEIAGRYCKEIILTDEDPYDESPLKIIREIKAGIPQSFPRGKVREILDRRDAIRWAIHSAGPGDIVVITGKGSEKSIHVARGKTIPWSDKSIVMDVLSEMGL